MQRFCDFTKLLPHSKEIEVLTLNDPEAAYILQRAQHDLPDASGPQSTDNLGAAEKCHYLIRCLSDKCWECIHTGQFSEVPLKTRKIYTMVNFFHILYLLHESHNRSQLEKCSALMDEALLLGCTQELFENSAQLERELMTFFSDTLEAFEEVQMPMIVPITRKKYLCSIVELTRPSLEHFQSTCFEPQQPALLLDTLAHWPAFTKWRDLNYIYKIAGYRTVPIEIGANYAIEEWSQQLVKIRDFMRRQFSATKSTGTTYTNGPPNKIEYLAQHELFDQIPALKADIRIPDYCTLGATGNATIDDSANVDIKAWFGPKGTVSPLHYDSKHNLLCQVFGIKRILLAAPADTPNLYPHETEFLRNTSQVDAANLDMTRFPLMRRVQFRPVTLQEGDCLYLPPRWWHYVRAESPSFSVSFWWNN